MNIALRKTHFRFAKKRVGIRKQTREKERELKKERERKNIGSPIGNMPIPYLMKKRKILN